MRNALLILAATLMSFSSALIADSRGDTATQSGERSSKAAHSTVLHKGIDGTGLTLAEKWSHDVVVCKRTRMTGSRFTRKVCHTRGEWQAMRANGWETTDYTQRIARDGGH